MSMEYEQSTGYFYINGVREATGFSGAPGYINNPAAQCEPDKGPLPRGRYIMTDGRRAVTRNSIRLTPTKDTEMCGRFGMLIHGDSIKNPGTGSTGCIILPEILRIKILRIIKENKDNSRSTILEVR